MTFSITEPCNAVMIYEESGQLDQILFNIPTEIPIEEVVDNIIRCYQLYCR